MKNHNSNKHKCRGFERVIYHRKWQLFTQCHFGARHVVDNLESRRQIQRVFLMTLKWNFGLFLTVCLLCQQWGSEEPLQTLAREPALGLKCSWSQKFQNFRSIIATLPSVPCLQLEAPMAVPDCSDVSTPSYRANWQRSAHSNRGETAMSPCLLKHFLMLNWDNKPLIWTPGKIFWLVLVLLTWISLFLGLWWSVRLTTCFVTEIWKVGLGNTFHFRKFTTEMLSRALSGMRCSIKIE